MLNLNFEMETCQTLNLELIQMQLPISPPLSPCVDDIEQEFLLNDAKGMLQVPIPENCLESKSTSFLILLAIGMGG